MIRITPNHVTFYRAKITPSFALSMKSRAGVPIPLATVDNENIIHSLINSQCPVDKVRDSTDIYNCLSIIKSMRKRMTDRRAIFELLRNGILTIERRKILTRLITRMNKAARRG